MLNITVEKSALKRAELGHPWLYINDVLNVSALLIAEEGEEFMLQSPKLKPIAMGYVSRSDKIAGYLLGLGAERNLSKRLDKLIKRAISKRGQSKFGRLIFAEGDGLPGIIADIYNNIIVVQLRNQGIVRYKSTIIDAIKTATGVENIRIDLPEGGSEYYGEVPQKLIIEENGIKYMMNPRGGQKTGFYYDQCENRRCFGSYAAGKVALDAFCYHGGFGLNALKNGAQAVDFIDSSQIAIEAVQANIELNEFKQPTTTMLGDCFQLLQQLCEKGMKYQLVSLDPPPFTKHAKDKNAALRAHFKLIQTMADLLEIGGIGFYSSCSNHITERDLKGMISKVKQLRIVQVLTQGDDHPVRSNFPEGRYLHTFVVEKYAHSS